MRIITIGGEPKELKTECGVCKNGKLWDPLDEKDKYYEDDNASKQFEAICSECLTKYVIDKEFKIRELTYDNILSWRNKILTSIPNDMVSDTTLKTHEGTFTLQVDKTSRKTKVRYKDKVFYDDLGAILEYLARKSMEYKTQPHNRAVSMF